MSKWINKTPPLLWKLTILYQTLIFNINSTMPNRICRRIKKDLRCLNYIISHVGSVQGVQSEGNILNVFHPQQKDTDHLHPDWGGPSVVLLLSSSHEDRVSGELDRRKYLYSVFRIYQQTQEYCLPTLKKYSVKNAETLLCHHHHQRV